MRPGTRAARAFVCAAAAALLWAAAAPVVAEQDQADGAAPEFSKTAWGLPDVRFDEANAGRLAVAYYAERGWNLSSTMLVGAAPGGSPYAQNIALAHTRFLNCSIRMLRQNMADTPMDFLVFAPAATLERDGPPPWWLRAPDVKVIVTDIPHKGVRLFFLRTCTPRRV